MPVITWTMQTEEKPTDAAEWEDIINGVFGAHGGEVTIDRGEKRRWRVAHARRVGRAAYKPGGVSALSENVGEQVTKALQEAGKAVDS
jgi:hypothetical protein